MLSRRITLKRKKEHLYVEVHEFLLIFSGMDNSVLIIIKVSS